MQQNTQGSTLYRRFIWADITQNHKAFDICGFKSKIVPATKFGCCQRWASDKMPVRTRKQHQGFHKHSPTGKFVCLKSNFIQLIVKLSEFLTIIKRMFHQRWIREYQASEGKPPPARSRELGSMILMGAIHLKIFYDNMIFFDK